MKPCVFLNAEGQDQTVEGVPAQGRECNKTSWKVSYPNHPVILFCETVRSTGIQPAHMFMPLIYCLSFDQKWHKFHFAVLKGFSQFVSWGGMCSVGTLGYAKFALLAQVFHRWFQKGIRNERCGFLYLIPYVRTVTIFVPSSARCQRTPSGWNAQPLFLQHVLKPLTK